MFVFGNYITTILEKKAAHDDMMKIKMASREKEKQIEREREKGRYIN